MGTIKCLGIDGVWRTYSYTAVEDIFKDEWHYRVKCTQLPELREAFEITVSEISETEVRVTAMHHHGEPRYVAKGIPDVLLPQIGKELRRIVSSSPKSGGKNIFRTDSATKVWERLVTSGIATYSKSEDIYRIHNQCAPG